MPGSVKRDQLFFHRAHGEVQAGTEGETLFQFTANEDKTMKEHTINNLKIL